MTGGSRRAPSRRDFSIGQRLAFGFTLLALPLIVLVALAFHWQQRNTAQQTQFSQEILPRTRAANTLERRMFDVAVGLRRHLVENSEASLLTHRQAVAQTRLALQELAGIPVGPQEQALFTRIAGELESYLAAADQFAASVGKTDLDELDRRTTDRRDRVLLPLLELGSLQEERTRTTVKALADAHEQTSRGLLLLTAVLFPAFLVLALLTTRFVRKPAHDLVRAAQELERGDFARAEEWAPSQADADGPARNEFHQIFRALGRSARALQRREARLAAEGRVGSAAANALDIHTIASEALPAVVDHAGGVCGVLYVHDSELLRPMAMFALDHDLRPMRPGAGIPGQAAIEGGTVIVRDIPEDTPFRIRFGFDDAPPRTIAAVPISFRKEVLGVLVVATLRDLDVEAVDFLERAAGQLGIALHNARAHAEAVRYATELQARGEEIQAQNEEIQAQNEEIQAQNEELTAQSEDLRRNAQALLEADQRKNEFLAVLAHEIRNPLAPIISGLDILQRVAPGSDQARRAQAIIDRQARHLTQLADALLDVTRVSRGKIQISPARIDLVPLVARAVEDHRTVFDASGLALAVHLPSSPLWIDGDSTRLVQVVGNLLQNAVKFTGRGGRVTLTLDRHGDEARIEVRDTGAGIDPRLLTRLFEPFAQAEATLDRAGAGLGLGLSLVKGLVELHRGRVQAHSDGPGCGASFQVLLPVAQDGTGAPQAPTGTTSTQPSRLRILVIEDQVDAADGLAEALRLRGHEVHIARDGKQGVAQARALIPDIVFCDIGLPEMDGYAVARALRAEPTLASTRLVALSGYALTEDQERARQAGFESHLAKPASMAQLESVLASPRG